MTRKTNFHTYKLLNKYPALFHITSNKRISTIEEFLSIIPQVYNKCSIFAGEQVHNDKITVIDSRYMEDNSISPGLNMISENDGLITNVPNTAIIVQTADCVPLLLYNREKKVIGAIHAGRKGTDLRIAEKAVGIFADKFGAAAKDTLAVIGPSIGPCCYQIDQEKNIYYDLWTKNQEQLIDAGLKEENIEITKLCTACNANDDFWSYRKDKTNNRTFSVMMLLDS